MATGEQNRTSEYVARFAEKQKVEKENLDKKIFTLEKKLKAKEALELEIVNMKHSVEVMMGMGEDHDGETEGELDQVLEELREKEEKLEDLEELNRTLTVKERTCNDELQKARKVLIDYCLDKRNSTASIGVKRMGQIDVRSISAAMRRKYKTMAEAEPKAAEIISCLQSYLSDPSYHPFTIVTYKNRTTKQIIDEYDENLLDVKTNHGEEVYNAMTTALLEMNEYNPSGRTPVPELYHFGERRATLDEGIGHILNELRTLKEGNCEVCSIRACLADLESWKN